MNKRITTKTLKTKTRRKATDKGRLRDKTITVKATESQKAEIQDKAAKCGMTPSSYLLSRGHDYHPKARLSDEEKALLQPIRDARSDLINFTNALNAMSDDERKQMFRRNSFMVKWLQEIGKVFDKVESYLNAVIKPNKLPPRTRKEAPGQ